MNKLLLTLVLVYGAFSRYFTLKNRKFYDPEGGEVVFHGVNIVKGQFPYENKMTEQDYESIKQMGLNAARVMINWPGAYPAAGVVNQTYIKIATDLINELGKRGIYSLVEYHQDLFGERTCGDGAPPWVTPHQIFHDFPKPVRDYPIQYGPDGRISNHDYCVLDEWSIFYRTYAVNRSFKALYANQFGVLDHFKTYWKKVAQVLKDNPYVIGYQIINEPWPGNMYKNPLVMVPGLSEVFNLQRFHDEVARQIRTVDPDQNIGFEPVTWGNAIPVGYSHAPGGKQYADRSILCIHYYSPPVFGREIWMAARKLDMRRLGVGGLLTQFMAVPGCPGDPQDYYPDILAKCDKYHIGWFAWSYHPSLNKDMITRVYAQRIGGTLVEHSYDPASCKYVLHYQSDMNAGATKIFFPRKYFPNGFIMTTDPKVQFEIKESKYILIDSKKIGNRLVIVKIEKAAPQTKGERVWYPGQEIKMEEKKEKKQSPRKERMIKQEQVMQERSRSRSRSDQKKKNEQKMRQKPKSRSRSRSGSQEKKMKQKQQQL